MPFLTHLAILPDLLLLRKQMSSRARAILSLSLIFLNNSPLIKVPVNEDRASGVQPQPSLNRLSADSPREQ